MRDTEHDFHISRKVPPSSERRKRKKRIEDRKDFWLKINSPDNPSKPTDLTAHIEERPDCKSAIIK